MCMDLLFEGKIIHILYIIKQNLEQDINNWAVTKTSMNLLFKEKKHDLYIIYH